METIWQRKAVEKIYIISKNNKPKWNTFLNEKSQIPYEEKIENSVELIDMQ